MDVDEASTAPATSERLTRTLHAVLRAAELGPEDSTVESSPQPQPRRWRVARRSVVVEFVRLIMVPLFALAGWEVAHDVAPNHTGALVLGIALGSGIGYVLGGVFGRSTVTAVSEVERELQRLPAADLLAGAIGLVVGLLVAVLVSIPIFHLPPAAAYPTVAFVYLGLGSASARIGRSKSEGLLALFGVKPRAAGFRRGEITVLDSSAVMDGRILPLVEMGFLGGTLLVPREVLDELQTIADSSDPLSRSRGRKALDLLLTLKREPAVELVLVEEAAVPGEEVDARLLRLCRERGGVLLTNDAALAKLAEALEVPARTIHALADALRTPIVPGERLILRLTRRGRERGQAVGYTEDGTMMVVEDAGDRVGETVPVAITNVIQTSTGQMAFGKLASQRDD
jgi:uncharacterized protein YacL